MILTLLKCEDCGKIAGLEEQDETPLKAGALRKIYGEKGWVHTGSPVSDFCGECVKAAKEGRKYCSAWKLEKLLKQPRFDGIGFTISGLCALGAISYAKRRPYIYKYTKGRNKKQTFERVEASNQFSPNAAKRVEFILEHYKQSKNIGKSLEALYDTLGASDYWGDDLVDLQKLSGR